MSLGGYPKQTCRVRSIMEAELVTKEFIGDLPLFTKSKFIMEKVNISDWGSLLTMMLSSMDLMRSVKSERDLINPLTKPLAIRLVSETSRRIGLTPNLWHYDRYPTSVIGDPMNEVKWVEVVSEPCEGTVSFYGFPLSRWGDLWWVHPYGVRQCKLQGDWGWALALNGSIVPTCWDGVFPACTPDGCYQWSCRVIEDEL